MFWPNMKKEADVFQKIHPGCQPQFDWENLFTIELKEDWLEPYI